MVWLFCWPTSGGTRMLLVSVIELTSEVSDWLCWIPAASVQWDVSVIRLNCGSAGSCSVVEDAKPPAPYQTLMVCVTVSEPRPACTRAQSSQSLFSPSLQDMAVLDTKGGAVPSGLRLPYPPLRNASIR